MGSSSGDNILVVRWRGARYLGVQIMREIYTFREPKVYATVLADKPLPPDFKDWPAQNQDAVAARVPPGYAVSKVECIPDPDWQGPPAIKRWQITIEATQGFHLAGVKR